MASSSNANTNNLRQRRDSGHLLLAILLMMALLVIAASYEAPRLVQQLKRDREEEMIHRGTEYARAIKKYYKKSGAYPTSLEQLEDTNNIRFLRKRYKDPLTKDGKWTLLHYSDVAGALLGAGGGPGVPAAGLATQGQQGLGTPAGQSNSSPFGSSSSATTSSGGFGSSSFGSANTQPVNQNGVFSQQQPGSGTGQQQGAGRSAFGSSTSQNTTDAASSSGTGSSGFGSTPSTGSGAATDPNAPSTTLGSQQGLGGQTFGAGAIVGISSKSKDPTIRVYNKKKTYDEWQFIYNPTLDQANVLLKGPYSPSTLASNTNIGTPAGQQNQQNSPFGQQNSPFGSQQPGGSSGPTGGSTPVVPPGGGQFPPDQSH